MFNEKDMYSYIIEQTIGFNQKRLFKRYFAKISLNSLHNAFFIFSLKKARSFWEDITKMLMHKKWGTGRLHLHIVSHKKALFANKKATRATRYLFLRVFTNLALFWSLGTQKIACYATKELVQSWIGYLLNFVHILADRRRRL